MIQELELLVRKGRINEARRILRAVNLKKIDRRQALAYANIARRLQLVGISLRVLNPVVRQQGRAGFRSVSPPTAQEKIEYAASLRIVGALSEAEGILREIDVKRHPRAGFYLALCLMSRWLYAPTIPLLTEYARSLAPGSYEMHVAMVNLLQALIHEGQLTEARGRLRELRTSLDRREFPLIYQKVLELAAQREIALEDWDRAIHKLEEARAFLDAGDTSDNSLYVAKWLAIANSMKSEKVRPELLQAKRRALAASHWEIVRDCDYFIARIRSDRQALLRLYFGTPYENFRAKIRSLLEHGAGLPATYAWRPGGGGGRESFDLRVARTADRDFELSAGQALHRLLVILSKDFFKPIPSLSLFSRLFPEEQYDPATSPGRARQLIARLRRWSAEHAAGLRIKELSGSYRIAESSRFSILLPAEQLPEGPRELELLRLRELLGSSRVSFSTREAVAASGSSRPTVQRLLAWAVNAERVAIEGRFDQARYRWLDIPCSYL